MENSLLENDSFEDEGPIDTLYGMYTYGLGIGADRMFTFVEHACAPLEPIYM